MRAILEFRDKNILIAEDVWNALKREKSTTAFSSIKFTAVATLQRDGAFMIYNDNIGIMRRFDRLPEFEAFMSEIDEERKKAGLEPLLS